MHLRFYLEVEASHDGFFWLQSDGQANTANYSRPDEEIGFRVVKPIEFC